MSLNSLMISNAKGVKNSEYIANANSNKHLDTMTTNDAKVNSDELVEGNKYLIINQCVDGKEYIIGTYAGGYGNLKKTKKLKIDNPSKVIIENDKIINTDPMGYRRIGIIDKPSNEYYLL